jgi:hypothetical protein
LRRAQNIRFWLVRTAGSHLAWLALVHPSQPSTAIQVLIRRRSRCGHGLPCTTGQAIDVGQVSSRSFSTWPVMLTWGSRPGRRDTAEAPVNAEVL